MECTRELLRERSRFLRGKGLTYMEAGEERDREVNNWIEVHAWKPCRKHGSRVLGLLTTNIKSYAVPHAFLNEDLGQRFAGRFYR